MFSKKNLKYFSLTFDFPVKKEESLVEEVIKKVPLSKLGLKTPDVYRTFATLKEELPQFAFSSKGIDFRLSRKALRLHLGSRPMPIALVTKRERSEEIRAAFSEKTLIALNNDLNFLIGKLSALLETKTRKIKASGRMFLGKELKSEVSFNDNLEKEVLESFKDFGEVNLRGARFEFNKKEGISSLYFRSVEKRLNVTADIKFSSGKPVNISELITNTLDELNKCYPKLKVG